VAVDKSSILENAQLYTTKGQYDKAIAEWKKLAAGTAADGTVYNTIGDLHLKRNAPGEAIEAYFQAAAAFRTGDAALKAIALYKKILKVDPARLDAYRCLGDINAERGLVSNAVADYLALAKMYLKAGKPAEASEIYRKIATLDPTNAEAKQYLGDQPSSAQGQAAPPAARQETPAPARSSSAEASAGSAAGQAKGPQEYSRQGFLNEAIKLTTAGQYTEAEATLMEVLSREPGDPEVCRLLATLHLKRGELACAKAEFQFLAEAAMRAHDYVLAESMLLEYLKADPSCVALCEILGRLYEQNGDAQSAVAQYGKALEVLQEHPDPEQPTLPGELYEKIVSLAPSSPIVGRFASVFAPSAAPPIPPPVEEVREEVPVQEAAAAPREDVSRVATEEPVVSEAPAEAQPVSRGSLAFKFAGAASESSPPAQAEPAKPAAKSSSFKFAGSAEAPAPEPSGAAEPPAQEPVAAEPAPTQESQPAMAMEPASAEARAAEADYGEHYQLGSAYQQMGLAEEAIQELEVSLNGPEWFVESCRLLAQCFKDQGRGQEAVSYLERAMADPRAKGESGTLVRYDLGLLYEAEGYAEQALQVFSTIPSFRDVPEHMAHLVRGDAPEQETVAVGHGGPVPDASPGDRKKRRISYL
jgi:tetratricopeptide (TPR) repeat protein